MPGTRPSILCTTSVGAPRSRKAFSKSNATDAGSLASHAYRRTPCTLSSSSRTGFSGFLAAMPTRKPCFTNSLAQLELIPGPAPTISATSLLENRVSLRRVLSRLVLPSTIGEMRMVTERFACGTRPDAGRPWRCCSASGAAQGAVANAQVLGEKNTRARTSMLSLGGASAGASGFSNDVWKDSLARPSVALSWTRIRIASSGSCSEK